MWNRVQSIYSIRKININILPCVCDPLPNPYYIKQNPVVPSEFVITRVKVN